MPAFRYVVDAYMRYRAVRHPAGHFLAAKKIGMSPESISSSDVIVICQRDKVHAALFEPHIDIFRIAITFAGNKSQARGGAHPRVNGVDVQVALHWIHD